MDKREIIKKAGLEVNNSIDSLFDTEKTTIMDSKNYIDIPVNKSKTIRITLDQLEKFYSYDYDGNITDNKVLYTITDNYLISIVPEGYTVRKIKENHRGYVYDFTKTLCKTDNIRILRKSFKKSNNPDSPVNCGDYGLLRKLALKTL